MNHKLLKFKNGFSLLESLIAITVLMVGVSSAIAALNQSVALSPKIKNKVIAAHLAQEGIELVRNIRDNNWIQGLAWNDNLTAGSGCVQYNKNNFDTACSYALNIDSGYYTHDGGDATVFSREITISYSAPYMKVISKVDCGQNCGIILEDYLFDWK